MASGGKPVYWKDGTTEVDDGKWHHVAMIKDGNTLRFYVDGIDQCSRPIFGAKDYSAHKAYSFTIGKASHADASYFRGTIDEVRVSNIARAIGDLNTSYASEAITSPTINSKESIPKTRVTQ